MASTLGFITAKYKGGMRLNSIIPGYPVGSCGASWNGIQGLVGLRRLVVVV